MSVAAARPDPDLRLTGWLPIVGAFSIWFAHFLVIYAAAEIWKHQPIATIVCLVATALALVALILLFFQLRRATPTDEQTRFAKRIGLGSIFIATVGTLFDALPALIA